CVSARRPRPALAPLFPSTTLFRSVFIATAAVLAPPAGELLRGLVVPRLPGGDGSGLLVAVGLIGTTVVPYNLFLHAAAVRERWSDRKSTRLNSSHVKISYAVFCLK